MADLPRLRLVTVHRDSPAMLTVRWSFFPHAWPSADLRVLLFRSNSPAGPWDEIGEAEVGTFYFSDATVNQPGVGRNYYYVVRVLSASNKGCWDSPPTGFDYDADQIATEMRRKKLTYFVTRGASPVAVIQRRTWGPNCNRCYNPHQQVAEDDNCPECFGTGYAGGYLKPYPTLAILNPHKRALIDAGVIYDASNRYIEFAHLPLIQPDDIIVDVRQNIRSYAGEITPTTHRSAVVTQMVQAVRMDELDICYTIQVPQFDAGYLARSWDLVPRAASDSPYVQGLQTHRPFVDETPGRP